MYVHKIIVDKSTKIIVHFVFSTSKSISTHCLSLKGVLCKDISSLLG